MTKINDLGLIEPTVITFSKKMTRETSGKMPTRTLLWQIYMMMASLEKAQLMKILQYVPLMCIFQIN